MFVSTIEESTGTMTMVFEETYGHETAARRFAVAFARNRLAGSYLFVGPADIGKRTFSFALAKAVLCLDTTHRPTDTVSTETAAAKPLVACGKCESCKLFTEKNGVSHPDFFYVAKPEDKSFLPLELLIGDTEHRGRSGLCYDISKTPFLSRYKVAIIDDADFLNAEGANSLLKTLEEPPPNSLLILIGTSTTKQLPTIRSRCRLVRFSPLSTEKLAPKDDVSEEIRLELQRNFAAPHFSAVRLAKRLNEYIETAGKEAPVRRRRCRSVLGMAITIFQNQLRGWNQPPTNSTVGMTTTGTTTHLRTDVYRAERTLEAMEQVDKNVNIPYIIDAWLQDL